ncbi:glycosyl transferase [Aureococcus anophagefferens]|nr:glycosyl transferase [Aureococcus anophagefferens]
MGSLLALVAAAAAAMTAAAAPPIAPANVSVVWHAPFFSGGGYCSEATTFVLGLAALGVPIGLEPHGDGFDQDYVAGLDDGTLASLRALTAPRRPPPRVAVCHSEPARGTPSTAPWQSSACPRRSRLGAPYTIGRTMFETDRLPDGWPERLNAVDEVPTEFHREIFEAAGVRNLQVVGEPVDTLRFSPSDDRYALPGVADDAFVVVSVFKWEKRKGWDVLLRAWADAFSRGDGAVLVLLTNAYHGGDDFEATLETFVVETLGEPAGLAALAEIVVLSKLPEADLPRLYRRADVVALPRGEGWGRPTSRPWPVAPPSRRRPGPGRRPTSTSPTATRSASRASSPSATGLREPPVAEPDAAHLAAILRRAKADPAERRALGAKARADMVARFSPAELAAQVNAHLVRIEALLDARSPRRGDL